MTPDDVWVANNLADSVSRIDPDTNLEAEAIGLGAADLLLPTVISVVFAIVIVLLAFLPRPVPVLVFIPVPSRRATPRENA